MGARTKPLAVVFAFVLAGAGCSEETYWPGDPEVEHKTVDIGYGLQADLPMTWEVVPAEKIRPSIPKGCEAPYGEFQLDKNRGINFHLNPRTCKRNRYRRYLHVDEVRVSSDISNFDTKIGPATMFLDKDIGCNDGRQISPSNFTPEDCTTFFYRTILIRLDEPFDPEFPVLQVVRTERVDGSKPPSNPIPEELRAVVDAIEVKEQ